MAAKAWSSQRASQQVPPVVRGGIEEIFFQNDAVSLCLLVNRRAKTMRVVDFRAGPTSAKRTFVLSLAQREGIEKVFTLVERDEVATWVKLGFAKEGNVPGFYKRSDAFLLGCSVTAPQRTRPTPVRSEMRLALGDDVDLSDIDDEPEVDTAAHELAERTIVAAKKVSKELATRPLPAIKLVNITEADAKRAVSAAARNGRALTGFELFGRDVERRYFAMSGRGAFELVASTEAQSCFGNTFLELLTSPRNEAERTSTVAALRALCEKLLAESVVSCFSLAPSDDVALATAFAFNGFRRTGLLQNHLLVSGFRKDATIWTRKLANPADE